MFLLTRTLIAAFAAAACLMAGIELRYRLDPGVLLLQRDPVAEAHKLAQQSRWAEAKMLADFVVANPALGDAQEAAALSARMATELDSFWGKARRFGRGAVTGEPTDTASMLGSLSLDLFVIGDIRDLAVQGWREASAGNGDKLIMALSAVGLLTTLAPEIDWAPAMAKAFKRSGAFSRRFTRNLGQTAGNAVKTGDFSKLGKAVDDLGASARHIGPGPLRGIMPHIHNTDELAKLSRAARVDATGTYGLIKLFGRDGVKRIAKDGSNISTLVGAIKFGSRATKLTRKATHVVPTPGLLIWLLAALLTLYMAVRPRRRRPPQKPAVHTPPPPERREPTLQSAGPRPEAPSPALPARRAAPSLSATDLR